MSIAYDGQEDASIELRLQAMHQAKEYSVRQGYNKPENWHLAKVAKKEKVAVQHFFLPNRNKFQQFAIIYDY